MITADAVTDAGAVIMAPGALPHTARYRARKISSESGPAPAPHTAVQVVHRHRMARPRAQARHLPAAG